MGLHAHASIPGCWTPVKHTGYRQKPFRHSLPCMAMPICSSGVKFSTRPLTSKNQLAGGGGEAPATA
eukprot:scaffold46464_cov70-Phaeocystis_antarctica.AAC.1